MERNTQQKEAIRGAFTEADRPLSPDEVLALAGRQVERLSLATVYRNINALVDDGVLVRVEVPGEAGRYELAGKQHHHHFQCDRCRKVFEIAGCFVADPPPLPKGFRSNRHEVFFYGSCAGCV